MMEIERLSTPAKYLLDAVAGGGKFDLVNKNWWEVNQLQKDTNEIINQFNIDKTNIYEDAQAINKSLSNLNDTQNKELSTYN